VYAGAYRDAEEAAALAAAVGGDGAALETRTRP
jgi:hypothetical protein